MARRLVFGSAGALVVGAALLASASCGAAAAPTPSTAEQPTRAQRVAARPTSATRVEPPPPPPARSESPPPPPQEDAVWFDGAWVREDGRWSWRAGRWVVVPPGVAFAPWTTARSSDGRLDVAEPAATRSEASAAAFVDAGLKPPPEGRSFPDAGPLPRDAGVFPDAFFRPEDAAGFDLDATPLPGAGSREMLGVVSEP